MALTCRSSLFYGKKRQRIQPLAETAVPSTVSVKEDIFAQLLVNVSDEGYDLYDGLSGFFDDTVEFEGSKAKMEVTLLELPPILQIQLQVFTSILLHLLLRWLTPARISIF
jgi:ubiquitin carboxyl-terminal hydrolase 25